MIPRRKYALRFSCLSFTSISIMIPYDTLQILSIYLNKYIIEQEAQSVQIVSKSLLAQENSRETKQSEALLSYHHDAF